MLKGARNPMRGLFKISLNPPESINLLTVWLNNE
ncbi:hypothetical protein NEOC65_000556 [Neochlamydia sp. AcF65]|nr:hypothetical protein [Neochlamydia sp. AcF65]